MMSKLAALMLFLPMVFGGVAQQATPIQADVPWSPPIAYEDLVDYPGQEVSFKETYVVRVSWVDQAPAGVPRYRLLLATRTEDGWDTYSDLILVRANSLPVALESSGKLLAISAKIVGSYCTVGTFDCEHDSIPALELVQ